MEAEASEQRRDAEGATDEPIAGGEADLATERDRLQVQLARAMADLQNIRKRHAKEMEEARARALEGFAAELLPVLDNFHLATDIGTQTGAAAVASMREGLGMVRTMLESVFERHGVTEITAEGAKFDPAVHEAVGIDPDPEAPEGTVTKVLLRGYRLGDRVIRASRVMVGGAAVDTTDTDQES